jgi:RAB6-interacting golgin
MVKRELAILDKDLQKDVGILQAEIEEESRHLAIIEAEFVEVERRYKELQSTIGKKKERKKMLTLHLSTIIGHHESRKADRLNELMEQVVLPDPNAFVGFSDSDVAPKK